VKTLPQALPGNKTPSNNCVNQRKKPVAMDSHNATVLCDTWQPQSVEGSDRWLCFHPKHPIPSYHKSWHEDLRMQLSHSRPWTEGLRFNSSSHAVIAAHLVSPTSVFTLTWRPMPAHVLSLYLFVGPAREFIVITYVISTRASADNNTYTTL